MDMVQGRTYGLRRGMIQGQIHAKAGCGPDPGVEGRSKSLRLKFSKVKDTCLIGTCVCC